MELRRLKLWGEGSGFEISGEAADGVEALKALRARRYDLVITDIRMPKLDGIQLLQAIREENLCPCVVLFSEHSEFEYARKGLVLGAFDYLIKPAEPASVASLLQRATRFLAQPEAAHTAGGQTEAANYPAAEEQRILALVGQRSASIPALFAQTANSVRNISGGSHAEAIIRRLYLNIAAATFSHYEWLGLYIDAQDIEDSTKEASGADGLADALRHVYGWIDRLLPAGAQGVLHSICVQILKEPESEISLAAVASQFYMNHTYLSNTFRQKTGIRFNDYLTSVRMARARYLLTHSDLRVYEISGSLGYKDADYFNRLFKKHNGQTPTECRRDNQRDS